MEKDIVCNAFFSDNERFADIINGIGCGGIPFVSGKDLQELDTKVTVNKHEKSAKKGRKATVKYRDLMRKASFGMNFAMIGIENQEKIDYALTLRTMEYDAGEYGRQAARIRNEVRKDCRDLGSGEYLYGFRKSDKLFPTVTIVLYFGEEEWDGEKNLHGILDFSGIPESLRDMVPDYRIHVVEVRKLQDTSIFRTDVKQVFDCIRFSEDKKKLKELVENDMAYQKLDEEAYDMVAAYAEGGEELFKRKEKNKEGEKINMGQGFRDWIADERAEAKAEGKAEGVAEAVIDLLSGHGNVGEQLKKVIMAEKDLEILRTWLKIAAVVDSVEEFETRNVIRN